MARNIKIALLLLAALATTAVAQNKFEVRKVDFEKIRQITLNSKAQFYYPRLLESYKGTDTTLNFEAYPFRKSEFSNKVEELYYKQPHSRAECDTIEKYAKLSLDDHIFDFDQMEFYIYVLKEKKKHALAAVKQFRLDRLIAAIMSSGKGTKDEPWVVIFPDHEYYIVNTLGYVATAHKELPGGIDHIAAKKNDGTTKDFYFDVSRMMAEANRKFPE